VRLKKGRRFDLEFISNSLEDTAGFAKDFAARLSGGEVVALYGGMGMGKTQFVRFLAAALGYSGEVSSPTFAIVHEYIGGRLSVYHFDMYRIESWDDLESTSFYDYCEMGGVVITEWSENIEGALPDDCIRIEITALGQTSRKFTVTENI
jgi:tRNA threonylcarbamoyladenosine biosynthesis protein TsaE